MSSLRNRRVPSLADNAVYCCHFQFSRVQSSSGRFGIFLEHEAEAFAKTQSWSHSHCWQTLRAGAGVLYCVMVFKIAKLILSVYHHCTDQPTFAGKWLLYTIFFHEHFVIMILCPFSVLSSDRSWGNCVKLLVWFVYHLIFPHVV